MEEGGERFASFSPVRSLRTRCGRSKRGFQTLDNFNVWTVWKQSALNFEHFFSEHNEPPPHLSAKPCNLYQAQVVQRMSLSCNDSTVFSVNKLLFNRADMLEASLPINSKFVHANLKVNTQLIIVDLWDRSCGFWRSIGKTNHVVFKTNTYITVLDHIWTYVQVAFNNKKEAIYSQYRCATLGLLTGSCDNTVCACVPNINNHVHQSSNKRIIVPWWEHIYFILTQLKVHFRMQIRNIY